LAKSVGLVGEGVGVADLVEEVEEDGTGVAWIGGEEFIVDGVCFGAALLTETPLSHFNFFPDFTQMYFFP